MYDEVPRLTFTVAQMAKIHFIPLHDGIDLGRRDISISGILKKTSDLTVETLGDIFGKSRGTQ